MNAPNQTGSKNMHGAMVALSSYRRPDPFRLSCATAILTIALGAANADIIVPLTSYEPFETGGLTVQPDGGSGTLDVAIVQAGIDGAPPATDGDFIVRIDYAGQSDGKIEFRHFWSDKSYQLLDRNVLLADVYVATPSALPGIVGIWDGDWAPPDAWQPVAALPLQTAQWVTLSFDVSEREQTDLTDIWAFVFEQLADTSGTIFVDNLRFRAPGELPSPKNPGAIGYQDHHAIVWQAELLGGFDGFNIYRAPAAGGPFTRINDTPVWTFSYDAPVQSGQPRYYYHITATYDGLESAPSEVVTARYNGLTDEQLLDGVQEAAFRYFWDGAHPVCGMAREGIGFGHPLDTVTTGGTGFGLMSIVVGAERGFVQRSEAAERVRTILAFLEDVTPRFHGAWAHHYNGVTGEVIPFATYKDNGADLVETAFLIEGILTARQYFDDLADPIELEINQRATRLWEGVEWSHFRRYPDSEVLYWHWSPDYAWEMDLPIHGFNETMIVYLLAIASPTYPMPPSSYYNGWATGWLYENGQTYYGHKVWVGPPYGGPLFFTHYSYLGFDPRYKRDIYCNYFENNRNISLVHQAFCIDNPNDHAGYNAFAWGLTASADPSGYYVHEPTRDNGVLTPTAALSAMPYTPEQSLATMRYFFDTYGGSLWGVYGFYDAFEPATGWTAPGYIAIDQGTIAPMIENYRSGLCWRLFMSIPEINPMLQSIGMYYEVDFDFDGDVDAADFFVHAICMSGPNLSSGGCDETTFADADLDGDADVDMGDVAILQELTFR